MPVIQNTVASALHVIDIPERACFTTWREFIESIPRFIGVEVPASVSGVVIGPDVPGEGDKDKVWFRRDRAGNFLGIYAFQAGAWRKLIQTNDSVTDIFWAVGDSNNPPDGFTVIVPGDPTMPLSTSTGIQAQYLPNPIGPGFSYFAMRFSGY